MFLNHVAAHPQFLTGLGPPRQYRHEIRNAKITLSPFGWGEVCFRDFEAVLNGSLLLKPNMDHLSTWPDIYRPDETYVPVAWDGDDLIDRAEHYLADSADRRRIVANAKDAYFDALRQVDERAHAVATWILGGSATQDWRDESASHSQIKSSAV
jgi:hypothetical protein